MPEECIIDNDLLTWYHFDDPDDPELVILGAHYSLHELALEDCISRSTRVKLDDYGDYLFVVLAVLSFDSINDVLVYDKLCVFVGKDFLITVCDGNNRSVNHVKARLSSGKTYDSVIELFHGLVDYACDQFLPITDTISEEISELEESVYEKPDSSISKKAISLKSSLSLLRRFLVAHREVINELVHRHPPLLDTKMTLYFRDIYDHLVNATELIETHRDLLTGLMEINLAVTAQHTNEIVKTLTIYATILLPLNVITGYFGMNFIHLPFIHNPNAVWFITLLLIFVAVGSLTFLRKRGL